MGFLSGIVNGFAAFVRRNPVTCLVLLILIAAAPSVAIGIANFILYLMLTFLLLGVIFVLLFRYRIRRLRDEMERGGGFAQQDARRRTYTWRARRPDGEVKVYKTAETPEKRVNDSVGEYVEFEEVDSGEPKK